jgi:maltose alpha-D-glucosyltransferase/alpha-amylase
MLLAEANQWPEDAVAYFGDGDECHMAFHFPVMPRLFMGIRMEDRLPILDILQQTPPIPPTCQWALFLRNHDELTLEMVTDEDRDYMYRVYARDPQARINLGIRRRLAPLLENQRPKIELMNALLFSLPGTPVLYYGDEIGMGDNIYLGDRNGVRTPMQWTGDRNAGFSRANPQGLYLPVIIDPEYHFEAVNVEVQQNNPHSLLWWTKRLIDLRKRHQAFGRGAIKFLTPANHKVLAFVRSYGGEDGPPAPGDDILVVANLSRFPQFVELDLGAFQGWTPVELLGRTPFPAITERPYVLTLGSYQFYWFALQRQHAGADGAPAQRPTLEVSEKWENVFLGDAKDALQDCLPAYLQTCPWFGRHTSQVEAAMVLETIPVPCPTGPVQVALVQVEYSEGDPETYVLPLVFVTGTGAEHVRAERPWAVVVPLRVLPRQPSGHEPESGVLYDPLGERPFSLALLEAMLRHRRFKRSAGELLALPTAAARAPGNGQKHAEAAAANGAPRPPRPADGELSALGPTLLHRELRNSSVVFGDRYILKLYRRIEDGINPEVEAGRFLGENTAFRAVPRLLGTLEYRRGWGEPMTLAVVHEFVPHQGDGWHYCQDALGRFFEHALSHSARAEELAVPRRTLLELAAAEVPRRAQESVGPVLDAARQLGQRTGELHLALASRPDVPAFAPEPFTTLYQRSLYQALRSQVRHTFLLLRKSLESLPEGVRAEARDLEGREDAILQHSRAVYQRKIAAGRIRGHGDFNLREVLYTGRDFVIIDFEGAPTRPLSDRRRKYTPLRDVASMVRSFDYAVLFALDNGGVRHEDRPALAPWGRLWFAWMSAAFLKGYLEAAGRGGFLPEAPEELELLFDFYLVKRALAELRYELTRSPDRAAVPIRGLLQVLDMLRAHQEQHA